MKSKEWRGSKITSSHVLMCYGWRHGLQFIVDSLKCSPFAFILINQSRKATIESALNGLRGWGERWTVNSLQVDSVLKCIQATGNWHLHITIVIIMTIKISCVPWYVGHIPRNKSIESNCIFIYFITTSWIDAAPQNWRFIGLIFGFRFCLWFCLLFE